MKKSFFLLASLALSLAAMAQSISLLATKALRFVTEIIFPISKKKIKVNNKIS